MSNPDEIAADHAYAMRVQQELWEAEGESGGVHNAPAPPAPPADVPTPALASAHAHPRSGTRTRHRRSSGGSSSGGSVGGGGVGVGAVDPAYVPNFFDEQLRGEPREHRRPGDRGRPLDPMQYYYNLRNTTGATAAYPHGHAGRRGAAATMDSASTGPPPRHVRERHDRAPAPYTPHGSPPTTHTRRSSFSYSNTPGGSGSTRAPQQWVPGMETHVPPAFRGGDGTYTGQHPSPDPSRHYNPSQPYQSQSLFGQMYSGGGSGGRSGGGGSGRGGNETGGGSFSRDFLDSDDHRGRGDYADDYTDYLHEERSFTFPSMDSGRTIHITTTGGGGGSIGAAFHVGNGGGVHWTRTFGSARPAMPDTTNMGRGPDRASDAFGLVDILSNLMGAMNPNTAADIGSHEITGMHEMPGMAELPFPQFFAQAFANFGNLGSFLNDEERSYEEWQHLVDRMGHESRGATADEISNLPTEVFSRPKNKSARVDPSASSSSSAKRPDEEPEKCPICLAEYEGGEMLKRLPCLHTFHDECVSRWLQTSKECPCCKASIRDNAQRPAST